jgi:hypothetical protein
MNQLDWLVGHRFQLFTRREHDWIVTFDNDVSIVVDCLWRLVESDRILITGEDNGQKFGLPEPLDSAAEVNHRLMGAVVEATELRSGILDLELRFSTGHSLQILPNSSGYEAWNLACGNRLFIAVGGGELAVFGGGTDSGRS